nr:ATP-binding cassette domain-containing protein [Bacilli bacterium]
MTNDAIAVEGVKKQYGQFEALRGIDLQIPYGEIFGFLGPNGAGKSTLIQILTTLALPTSGHVNIAGIDVIAHPDDVRFTIGVALQDTGVDPLLTGRELLILQARLFGMNKKAAMERASELLHQFGLEEAADRRVKTYSGGMRRRLDLSLSLVHRPKILFLDEPTTGLDPQNRLSLWELLRSINQETDTTIFLTTQYLEEADALCGQLAIIDHGQIIERGSPQALKRKMRRDVIDFEFMDRQTAEKAFEMVTSKEFACAIADETLHVFTENGAQDTRILLPLFEECQLEVVGLKVTPPTLDDVFIQLTGQEAK